MYKCIEYNKYKKPHQKSSTTDLIKREKNQWAWRQNIQIYPMRRGKERPRKSEEGLRALWNTIKGINLFITEGDKRENSLKRLFKKIMAENFPNKENNNNIQV